MRDAGLIFIGPSSRGDRDDGQQDRGARCRGQGRRAGGAGTEAPFAADGAGRELVAAADRVGYPLLVKAVAGGGGKGMRTVRGARRI